MRTKDRNNRPAFIPLNLQELMTTSAENPDTLPTPLIIEGSLELYPDDDDECLPL